MFFEFPLPSLLNSGHNLDNSQEECCFNSAQINLFQSAMYLNVTYQWIFLNVFELQIFNYDMVVS